MSSFLAPSPSFDFVDAVWMFRITFAVNEGEKSYKKDRFVDLGAQTQEKANEWKRALEAVVNSVREHAEWHEPRLESKADNGPLPAAVKKFFENDDDAFLLCKLCVLGSKERK